MNVEIDGLQYSRITYSFYGTEYEKSIGNAMIFRDASGTAVGFYDRTNYNSALHRPGENEAVTTFGRRLGGFFGSKPYDLYYGTYKKP